MPRGRPTEIPEDAILDAARDLLLKKGLRATTAEIAARAGTSEGLVFYRYRTKDALLVAVLEREQRVPPRLEALTATAGQGALRDNLEELGALMLEAARSIHPLVELVFTSPRLPRLRRLMSGPNTGPALQLGAVTRYLSAEMAVGRLRPLDPELLAHVLFGTILDRVLGVRARVPARPAGDEEFLAGLADLLLRGALPEGPGRAASSRRTRGLP